MYYIISHVYKTLARHIKDAHFVSIAMHDFSQYIKAPFFKERARLEIRPLMHDVNTALSKVLWLQMH